MGLVDPLCRFFNCSRPIKTVLDIGANTGESIYRFRKIWPDAKIYSFEPRAAAFEKLFDVAADDGNCEVFNLALGEENKETRMQEYEKQWGGSSLLSGTDLLRESRSQWAKDWHWVDVKMARLDDLMLELEPDMFIKVDVQSYQDFVIRGGLKTFAAAEACLIEIYFEECYEGSGTVSSAENLLVPIGFRMTGMPRVVRRGKAQLHTWSDVLWEKML